ASPHEVTAFALRVPAAIVFDHLRQRTAFVTEPGHEALAAQMQADLAEARAMPDARAVEEVVTGIGEEPPQRYLDCVRRAKEYIAAGDIYQANLSRLWRTRLADAATPAHVYARLRRANPAPFAASCVWNDFAVLSSSPERLCA